MRGYRAITIETETSQFDSRGRWVGGSEYYSRTDKVLVPVRLKEENIDEWLERNSERQDIWLT